MSVGLIIVLLIYVALTVSALFLMKSGVMSGSYKTKTLNFSISPAKLIGIIFYILSFLIWMMIIQQNDISYVFPIGSGLVYITVFIVGSVVFNEKVTIKEIIAAILILSGIIIMNIG